MKKVNIVLLIIIVGIYLGLNFIPNNVRTSIINSDINIKYLDSSILTKVIEDEEIDDIVEEKEEEEEIEQQDISDEIESNEKVYFSEEKKTVEPVIKNNIVESVPKQEEASKESFSGKMSAYGPDCSGCSGYLGSGRYVGDGNIYYDDAIYGRVRIVAGDSKYSYGTIVKIEDKTGSFLAIILDRGGGIGLDKKYTFDLLFSSEADASNYGISNAKFEILRYGY